MLEVTALKQADNVVEEFRALYKQRYGADPILDSPLELQIFLKGLIKKMGEDRTRELVRYYLRNDGHMGWWAGKGHSVKIFKTEIEAINASYALTNRPKAAGTGYNPMITFDTGCPKCERQFPVTCRASDADKHAYTTHCPACTDGPQAA